MAALGFRDLDDLVGVLAIAGAAAVPHLDDVTRTVAEVLQPPGRADHRVVAPVVRRVVALLVGEVHPVVQLEIRHREVLDVHHRRHPGLAQRRPVVVGDEVGEPLPGTIHPVLNPAVHGEAAEGVRPGGVAAGQPVHHVDVVGTLLQQQAGGPATVGVPVLEVEVAAVPDEVPAPDRLHLADRAGGDQFAHRQHHRHVPHVVADVQPGAALVRGLQHAVAAGGGDRQRLLHEHRYAGPEEVDRRVLVQVVGVVRKTPSSFSSSISRWSA